MPSKQVAMMANVPREDFVNECNCDGSGWDGLSMDELYGLYLSWCGLKGFKRVRDRAFRAAVRAANIRPAHCGSRRPGLMMSGPAARDYLLHRELPLLALDIAAGPAAAC
jgi:hypothetical protein